MIAHGRAKHPLKCCFCDHHRRIPNSDEFLGIPPDLGAEFREFFSPVMFFMLAAFSDLVTW